MTISTDRARRIGSILLAIGLTALYACSDSAIPPTASQKAIQQTHGFTVHGTVHAAVWRAGGTNPRLMYAASVPLNISAQGAQLQMAAGVATITAEDSARAASMWAEVTAANILARRNPSGAASATAAASLIAKATLKARTVVDRAQNGKRIKVAFVHDDNDHSGRPPKTVMLLVDNRLASISDYTYSMRSGRWQPDRAHITVFDSAGRAKFISNQDLSDVNQQTTTTASGLSRGSFGDHTRFSGLVRALQPDALYAETAKRSTDDVPCTSDEGGACFSEGVAVALAAAASVVAYGYMGAMDLAIDAANLTLTAALASCVPAPETCGPAVLAATAGVTAAYAAWSNAAQALTVATGVATAASIALDHCLQSCKKPDQVVTGPSGGGDPEGGAGCEQWCQWTLSFDDDGNVASVTTDSCWCEYAE